MNISEIEKIPAKEILLWVKERTFQKNALPFKGRRGITDSGTDKRWVRQLADETRCDREH